MSAFLTHQIPIIDSLLENIYKNKLIIRRSWMHKKMVFSKKKTQTMILNLKIIQIKFASKLKNTITLIQMVIIVSNSILNY